MNHAKLSAFLKSERFVHLLTAIGFVIIAIFIFEAGVAVGFHKAGFARAWEEHYRTNFGAPSAYGIPSRTLPDPHGAVGTVVSVTPPTFAVTAPGRAEEIVRIGDDTLIRDGAATVSADDIAPGKYVIVIGMPGDEGVIDARLVRVLPPPASATTTPAQ